MLRWGVQRWKQVEERVNADPPAAAASSDRSTYSPEMQEWKSPPSVARWWGYYQALDAAPH
jgi:hypothetical protein